MSDPTTAIRRVNETILAACPGLVRLSVPPTGTPTVEFVPSAESTEEQRTASAAVIAAFDWSDAAQSAWELSRTRASALTGLLTRPDDTAIGVRAGQYAVTDLINLRLAEIAAKLTELGKPLSFLEPKVLISEVMLYIQSNPTLGDPLVPP